MSLPQVSVNMGEEHHSVEEDELRSRRRSPAPAWLNRTVQACKPLLDELDIWLISGCLSPLPELGPPVG